MKKRNMFLLAAGHGLNDCIAGFFLGSLALLNISPLQIGIGVTLYNLLAFGGQYPVAIWLEKTSDPKRFIVASYGLNIAAILVFYFSPQLAILMAGIASAVYHVAGGTVCAQRNKAFHIGIFAAPGVAGLITGGLLAWNQVNIISILLALSILIFFFLSGMTIEDQAIEKNENLNTPKKSPVDQHDLIMILLLMIISLRSVVWNIFQLVYENNYSWLIAIGLSAFIGKIAGGWLADKIGWRLYAIISIVLATPLLTLFRKEWFLFCLGIGLLQSGIPATTSLLIQSLKGKTARGISLSFGAAIIMGAFAGLIPLQLLLEKIPFILFTSFMLMVIFILWYRRQPYNFKAKI
jgi:MFS transporter, FSR family, fosmidomycin resistance protein